MRIPTKTLALLGAALAVSLAGCSEEPQVVRYEQGKYQGKTDTRPWEAATFAGDKAAWEETVRQRVRGQNEYNRVQ